jgi:hypothetical protein
MTIDDLKTRISRLHRLLEDPHPGLFTYHEAIHREMSQLIEEWNKETKPAPRPPDIFQDPFMDFG